MDSGFHPIIEDVEGWRRVRRGLAIARYALIASGIAPIVWLVLASNRIPSATRSTFEIVAPLLAYLIGPLLLLLGLVILLWLPEDWAPEEVAGPRYVRAAVVMNVVLIVLILLITAFDPPEGLFGGLLGGRRVHLGKALFTTVLITTIMSLQQCGQLWLRSIALHFRLNDLASRVDGFRWLVTAWAGAIVLGSGFQSVEVAFIKEFGTFILCLAGMGVPLLFLWQIALVQEVEKAITKELCDREWVDGELDE